ncbi:acyl-CoA dehydrogenase [Rhodoferax sp.]|uniref:acyl-CoA dehydrogenase n=1 Tax=Rhodoferax sp. TaxID=50421 RepID=UPI00284C2799|nr:acyl-CoA dehydrogenase [Rhodoferax sp.]MDR3368373.1 acyl-CoA dehydrogenase [Rhodoferax sp.]
MNFRTTLDFLLHDWLNVNTLTERERFADHSCDTFDAVLDTCERIARDKFAPFNRLVDTQEPRTETLPDGNLRVVLPQATADAYRAYADSGMLSAAQSYELGGMQLPYVVEAAANAFFGRASVSIGFGLLTAGNANLLMAHGTPLQQQVFAANEFSGRWSGTMCLSEPQAGSSLSDVATRAVPDGADHADDPLGPRYRLKGNKMWISAGDHELTENIVHLVLAKIPDADGKLPAGVKGISLFIVPKFLVTPQGEVTATRNDVALAGLNHKLGWRGTTNTLLNFGEGKYPVNGQAGAVGYLVGQPGRGLSYMFHMMNEARIGVGMAATMLGMAGYEAALDYAKNRPQGRPLGASGKDASAPQVRIIEHADVKRMLLAQKAYCEGALALELYCARLVDEQHTAVPEAADEARLLLEVLTPIAKSWPSEWCLEANSLAIQVHGGYGYTRDFPVEQYWRDNRLNMIHEGTHGIQAMDLLGRKVLMEESRGLKLLAARMLATAQAADTLAAGLGAEQAKALRQQAAALRDALQQVGEATQAAWASGNPTQALANAVPYLQAFGHTVLAWVWLDVALAVLRLDASVLVATSRGKLRATAYFYHYELPKIGAWLQVVKTADLTCAQMGEDEF